MKTEDWILEAVRFYNGESGADVDSIIEYIDYRDHFRYETGEIVAALNALAEKRRVLLREGKCFLSNDV